MAKRFLIVLCGAALGVILAAGVSRQHSAWSLWPDRAVDRDAAYFRKVLGIVGKNYVDEKAADYDKLTEAALEGMLRSLDPHSEFMKASDYRELREEMDGKFGGIGIQVERRDNRVVVIAPIADTPGERAGILRGDEIVKVDGESIAKLGMDGVIARLRGKPKTKVALTLYRPRTRQTIEVTVVREIIPVASVRDAHMIAHGIGYVQLTQFGERTGAEFKEALHRLQAQGLKALVLDLRNNPGGLLDSAVAGRGALFQTRRAHRLYPGQDAGQPRGTPGGRVGRMGPGARRRAGELGHGECGGDRGRGAEGHLPRGDRGRDDVRERLGADDLSAQGRRGPAPDDGQIFHARRRQHQ